MELGGEGYKNFCLFDGHENLGGTRIKSLRFNSRHFRVSLVGGTRLNGMVPFRIWGDTSVWLDESYQIVLDEMIPSKGIFHFCAVSFSSTKSGVSHGSPF